MRLQLVQKPGRGAIVDGRSGSRHAFDRATDHALHLEHQRSAEQQRIPIHGGVGMRSTSFAESARIWWSR